jgi:hypothetical protein
MLIKCACSNCGHSYLADDEIGDLACPRCDAVNDPGVHNPSEPPGHPSGGFEPAFGGGYDDHREPHDDMFDMPMRFEAKAPPPMIITRERLFRGVVFGGLTAAFIGIVAGAAMTAVGFDIPGIAAVLIALIGGAAVRSGFGGRTARQTKGRAVVVCTLIAVLGFAGVTAGSWTVARFTGGRAAQTRKELDEGLRGLRDQYADASDAGVAILLKQRVEEARRLQSLSDAELEDYIWVQQARINQPLLAYAKLRHTTAPIVRLGEKAKPIRLPMEAVIGIRAALVIATIILALRAVRPR